jgi:hypothetical protein
MLERILGPIKEEITGERRKVYNKELHNLYDLGLSEQWL